MQIKIDCDLTNKAPIFVSTLELQQTKIPYNWMLKLFYWGKKMGEIEVEKLENFYREEKHC